VGPQFTYLPPHLAVDPFHEDALTTRRKQLLDVLEKIDDPGYAEIARDTIAELDFERGFFVLQNCMPHLRNLDRWEEVWRTFEQRHGRLAGYVEPSLEGIVWRDRLVSMRSSVLEAEHRFFLALLLNVPRREDLLSLVEQRFGGDPVETIVRWAEELGETSEIGTWILDAEFPEELATPPPQQAAVFLAALRHFIRGGTAANEIGLSGLPASKLKTLHGAFSRSCFRCLLR
jgi:hypothetical protein